MPRNIGIFRTSAWWKVRENDWKLPYAGVLEVRENDWKLPYAGVLEVRDNDWEPSNAGVVEDVGE